MTKSREDKESNLIRIVTVMREANFEPMAESQIVAASGLSKGIVWREMKKLEQAGWARYDADLHTWTLGHALAEICFAYERHYLQRRKSLDDEYMQTTGKRPPTI